MSGWVVIAAYRPKPGHEERVRELVRSHTPRLREAGLVTDREPIIAVAKDGTFVECFEWVEGGVERAHVHPDVLTMWAEFGEVCDYVSLRDLAESAELFAGFSALP